MQLKRSGSISKNIFLLSVILNSTQHAFSPALLRSQMASPSAASPVEKSRISPASGGGVFVAPVFVQTPLFSHQFFKPRRIAEAATGLVRKIETSISENVERCMELFHLLASQNPLLKELSSLTCEFNALSQMRRRNCKNLNSLSNHNFAAVLPGDSVAGVVVSNGILNFLNIYNTLLVARLVLTWFPNAPPAIVSPLSTICDPYLNIFRGLIPPLGGTLDLSPILAFLILNAFTSTASALPAELPPDGASLRNSQKKGFSDNIASSQKKWMRRLQGNSSENSGKFE